MILDDFYKILFRGEDLHAEFKEAKEKVPASFYETVVSFLNRERGIIVLGVGDDGLRRFSWKESNWRGLGPFNRRKNHSAS